MIVELDLVSQESISSAFATIRHEAGDPDVLIYNAGYLEGRDLPPDKELLEYVPVEILDTGLHIAARGPFLVAKEVLPEMRKKGAGPFFFSNKPSSLRRPRAVSRRQGSAAGDAQKRRALVLLLQLFQFAARQEADDRSVALLPGGH